MNCLKQRVCAVLIASISSTAADAFAAQDPTSDRERVFAMRCAKCHTIEKLRPQLSRRAPDARAAFLERFLSRHYAPDAAEARRSESTGRDHGNRQQIRRQLKAFGQRSQLERRLIHLFF
jgi:hypothetical protein